MVELWIMNGDTAFLPAVESGIAWKTARFGEPGTLQFKCVQDDVLSITEGNAVKLIVDGVNVFFGFIFAIGRDKTNIIQVTAYDQLRYLKNKDSYLFANKRADEVVQILAEDHLLKVGSLVNTGYVIPKQAEDNKTLFDMIQNSLDETLTNTKRLYVLYDDFGSLALKDVEDMLLNLLIDADTAQSFDYKSSINDNTYNQVKLVYDNKDTGKREVYIAKDSKNINAWGLLQYFETTDNPQGAAAKVEALLSLYNAKTRNLKVSKAFGDVRVRAGSSVVVNLNLGDVAVQSYMLVENVTHTFENGLHTMDLTLRGAEFVA